MAKGKKQKGKGARKGGGAKSRSSLKTLASNPLVADVVAAALVATASALKDSKRARALASEAGDELAKLSKAGAEQGSALWEMALQIGKRSLKALAAEPPEKEKKKASDKKPKQKKARAAARKA